MGHITRWLLRQDRCLKAHTPSVTNASLAELLPALQRLDRLIEQAVTAAQVAYGPEAAADPYRGLYISQKEVERLLAREPGASVLWSEWTEAEESSPIRPAMGRAWRG